MHTLRHTTHFLCGCKCGSPWRRDHLDTTHDLWASAHFMNALTLAFLILVFCWLFFLATQHISTTKSTTIVLVYKYIPFFLHKVYTFFFYGVVFCLFYYEITTTSPPKKGSLKLRTWWRWRVVNSGAFFVCETRHSHRLTTQNAQLSPFDLLSLEFFFSFLKIHKYSKKIKNIKVPNLKQCWRKVL